MKKIFDSRVQGKRINRFVDNLFIVNKNNIFTFGGLFFGFKYFSSGKIFKYGKGIVFNKVLNLFATFWEVLYP